MGYKTYTCPFARTCGGCEWLAVPYPIQLKRKEASLLELFSDLIQADKPVVEPLIGMDEPRAYRHKAAGVFVPRGKGGFKVRCGLYSAGTHRVVCVDECLVEDKLARALLHDVANLAQKMHIRAYQEDTGRGVLRHGIVRSGYATNDVMLTLVANTPNLPHEKEFVQELTCLYPQLTCLALNVNQRRTNAMLGQKTRILYGKKTMRDRLLGCTFEIGPTSFYQTNPAQTEVLYAKALEYAGVDIGNNTPQGKNKNTCEYMSPLASGAIRTDTLPGLDSANLTSPLASGAIGTDSLPLSSDKVYTKRILDSYCGAGTIGICLAKHSNNIQVTGVESIAGAVKNARVNARLNEVEDRCSFVAKDATAYLKELARKFKDGRLGVNRAQHIYPVFDTVIMDPPRAGSTPEFLDAIAALGVPNVVYVSCNPVTQVRDIAHLRTHGYKLTRLASVDMFPHTKHVETVALMSRE